MEILNYLVAIITILNMLFAVVVIFLERRDVAVTWAWLMVFFFLPVIGFILYLILGQNLSRLKIYKIQEEKQKFLDTLIELQKGDLHRIRYNDASINAYHDLIYMNLTSGYSYFTQDNDVEIFVDGFSKFDALFQDIEQAKHHVHLIYYIIKPDDLGKRLVQLLVQKAKEGIEVRLLYDDVGSHRLPRGFFNELRAAGGQVSAFFPSKIPLLNYRLNYRNHRKMAIIDGKNGYIGGFNVGDEYLGLDPHFGEWRDTHLKISGTAVLQMQGLFILDWNLASAKPITDEMHYLSAPEHKGNVGLQILSSGPDQQMEQIKNAYIKMIYTARESIFIQTPYFIPDESLKTALKIAAMSGIDVRIMLPSRPDHRLVYWASISYLDELLEVGGKCFLYEKGFLHAKTMVVDGEVASVGTANIDIRSFKLNFEVNAFIYDPPTATRLKNIFLEDMKHSRILTLDQYKQRTWWQRVRESWARLLSPIL